ncbi:MAG: hypothetical protein K6L75_08355 [Cellvibrionaceae bacterium]
MNYLNFSKRSKNQSFRAVISIALLIGLSVSELAYAVDPSQLWLPRNYNRFMKELKQAVEVAEATDRCKKVIAGTVSTKDSVKEHPIFKITCRDEDRKTFPWLVDSKTMIIVNKPKEKVEKITEENNVPLVMLTDEEKKVLLRQEKVWSVCSYRLKRRVKHLRNLSLNTKKMPLPQLLENNGLMFEVEFSALAGIDSEIEGEKLSYKALCRYEARKYDLNIVPLESLSTAITDKMKGKTKEKVDKPTQNVAQKNAINLGEHTEKNTEIKVLPDASKKEFSECLAELKRKTAALDQVVWLTEEGDSDKSFKQTVGMGTVISLEIEFTAIGPTGRQLHSTGICRFTNDGLTVAIQNRMK